VQPEHPGIFARRTPSASKTRCPRRSVPRQPIVEDAELGMVATLIEKLHTPAPELSAPAMRGRSRVDRSWDRDPLRVAHRMKPVFRARRTAIVRRCDVRPIRSPRRSAEKRGRLGKQVASRMNREAPAGTAGASAIRCRRHVEQLDRRALQSNSVGSVVRNSSVARRRSRTRRPRHVDDRLASWRVSTSRPVRGRS